MTGLDEEVFIGIPEDTPDEDQREGADETGSDAYFHQDMFVPGADELLMKWVEENYGPGGPLENAPDTVPEGDLSDRQGPVPDEDQAPEEEEDTPLIDEGEVNEEAATAEEETSEEQT
jgi:hypothetical protein